MDDSLGRKGGGKEEVAIGREGEGCGRVGVSHEGVDFFVLAEVNDLLGRRIKHGQARLPRVKRKNVRESHCPVLPQICLPRLRSKRPR